MCWPLTSCEQNASCVFCAMSPSFPREIEQAFYLASYFLCKSNLEENFTPQPVGDCQPLTVCAEECIYLHHVDFFALCSFFFFFFKFIYLFWERQRQPGGGRGREREGERENPKQALHCQHRVWRGARTCKTVRGWPEPKPRGPHITNWAPRRPLPVCSLLSNEEEGLLGGSVGWATDFGSGHDLEVLEF